MLRYSKSFVTFKSLLKNRNNSFRHQTLTLQTLKGTDGVVIWRNFWWKQIFVVGRWWWWGWLKVHIFWEGHKVMQNLHCIFHPYYTGQINCGDFAKFCGILRRYELYIVCTGNFWLWLHSTEGLFLMAVALTFHWYFFDNFSIFWMFLYGMY